MKKFRSVITDTKISADKKSIINPKWAGIIVHHTDTGGRDLSKESESFLRQFHKNIVGWLTKADNVYVSAHFQIGRMGEVTMMVDPETHIAYHAGQSSYFHPILRKAVTGWNNYSIGIELLGDGNIHEFSEAQYVKLAELCNALLADFPTISPFCVTGHENIAPGRKVDPGRFFDARKFFRSLKF